MTSDMIATTTRRTKPYLRNLREHMFRAFFVVDLHQCAMMLPILPSLSKLTCLVRVSYQANSAFSFARFPVKPIWLLETDPPGDKLLADQVI